jgi:hypothetical protein
VTEQTPVRDAERERAVEFLAEHAVAGDLSDEERAARTRRALEARTQGDLADATHGLTRHARPPLLMRVADRVPLRAHVAAFLGVSAAMLVVWALTRSGTRPDDDSTGFFWPFWIMLVWGVALTAHALYALRRPAFERPGRPR